MVLCYEPMIFEKQSEFLEKIKSWGFVVNPHIKKVKGIIEIEEQHKIVDNSGHFELRY